MTKTILLNRRSLLTKLFVLVMLLVGGGNSLNLSAQKLLPYSYNFGSSSDNSFATEGWSTIAYGSTGLATFGGVESSYCYRFYPNAEFQYLLSPELANSETGVDVSFYYKGYGSSYPVTFHVGYSTTTSDIASFTWGDEITYASSSYTSYVNFYPSGTKYIGIKYTSSTINYYLFVDDFSVTKYNAFKDPQSFIASNITATTANLSWNNVQGSSPISWQIKYKNESFTPGDEDGATLIDGIATNSYLWTELTPETTYYVFVRACYDGGNSEWVQVSGDSFTTLELYPTPISFALNSVTGESATFSWSNGAGTTPSAWQIKYSEKQGFDPDSEGTLVNGISKKPYTLTGLTENTTYYARIRADYGSSHYSQWNTGEVTFKPTSDITINESSLTTQYVPIRRLSVDTDTKSQMIIVSSKLVNIRNRQLRKLVFYSSTASAGFNGATFDVFVKETNKSTFSSTEFDNVTGVNVLANATLSVVGNQMEVVFDVPFNYTNGNLMITFTQNSVGSSSTAIYWYALYSSNISYYEYGTTPTKGRENYSPKMTIVSRPVETAPVKIGATGYTTFASSWPLDLSDLPDGLTAYVVASGAVDANVVRLTKIESPVPANTGLVLKGTAGTIYNIPVASSGDALESNLMVGVCPLETTLSTDASKYVLVNNSGTPEFQDLSENGATIPAGKAYLNASGAGSRLSIVFDDPVVTGIAVSKVAERSSNGIVYNLMGQKVVKPSNGLYVINGKKVIKK